MCVYTYTYIQAVDLTQLDCLFSGLCKADTGAWSPEEQAGKEDGQKMGGTKKGHPRTCPRRVSNTLFMENISSKKQVPPGRIWIRIGFPGGTGGREPICQCRRHRDVGLLPGLGRFPRGGNGNPPRYSYLENPMDREVWRATAHRVTKKVRNN